MSFSQETKDQAFARAGGMCECKMNCHSEDNVCGKDLSQGEWEAHHIVSQDAGGSDGIENCMVMCTPCHKNTGSFGG